MSREASRAIRRLVEAEVKAAEVRGGTSSRAIAENIAEHHRDEIEGFAFELALDAITAMARNTLKAASRSDDQYPIPGLGDALPRFISVPGNSEESDRFVPLRKARVSELRRSTERLFSSIAADMRRANAQQRLLVRCEEVGASDDDIVLDVLIGRGAA